jgi:hypothetical protein
MADTQLAHRVFAAINALEQKLKRRITLAELGERVAKFLGEDKATDASVVARWAKGKQTPRSREGWAAFAAALEVDPGWLTFGTGSMTVTAVSEAAPMHYGAEVTPAAEPKTAKKPPAKKRRRAG